MYRIKIDLHGEDFFIENEDKSFLIDLVSAISDGRFAIESLEWVGVNDDFVRPANVGIEDIYKINTGHPAPWE